MKAGAPVACVEIAPDGTIVVEIGKAGVEGDNANPWDDFEQCFERKAAFLNTAHGTSTGTASAGFASVIAASQRI